VALWSKKSGNKTNGESQQPAQAAPSAPPATPEHRTPAKNGQAGPQVAPAAAPQAPAASGSASPATEEEQRRRNMLGLRLAAAFSSIVSAMMRSKAHRELKIADLERYVLPAVRTRQFSIAQGQQKGTGMTVPLGFVLWASVSPEVDRKLAASPDKPLEIAPQDWRSGEIVWIVEAVGEPAVTGNMLKRLCSTDWKGRTVKYRVRDQSGQVSVRTLDTSGAAPTKT
jgi:hemolysin-activating ACP:hemolysin acyltransferase